MKLKQKYVVAVMGGLVLLTAAYFIWFNGSNNGKISPVTSPDAINASPTGYKDFEGKYIRFSYPSSYMVHTLKATDNDLEFYKFSADTSNEKDINVSVSTLPKSSLDQNSAYNFRKTRTDIYKESHVLSKGGVASVWTRSNNLEVTVFIQRGGRVAVLSFVQTQSSEDDLQKEAEKVIQSFSWK